MEGKSKYEVIAEKLKDVKTFAEAKEILTDEEMVYYFMDATDNLQERLRDVKSEISEVIQQIPVKEYNVLHKLYIQGKDLDDVAADNKKSYSWASTMHGRALAHVQGVLDTLEALPENSEKGC